MAARRLATSRPSPLCSTAKVSVFSTSLGPSKQRGCAVRNGGVELSLAWLLQGSFERRRPGGDAIILVGVLAMVVFVHFHR
jgi:hypothetical protein